MAKQATVVGIIAASASVVIVAIVGVGLLASAYAEPTPGSAFRLDQANVECFDDSGLVTLSMTLVPRDTSVFLSRIETVDEGWRVDGWFEGTSGALGKSGFEVDGATRVTVQLTAGISARAPLESVDLVWFTGEPLRVVRMPVGDECY